MSDGTETCVHGDPVPTNGFSGVEAVRLPSKLQTKHTEKVTANIPTPAQLANEPTALSCCKPTNEISPPDTLPDNKHAKDCSRCMAWRVAANDVPQRTPAVSPASASDEADTTTPESLSHASIALKVAASPVYLVLVAYLLHLLWCLSVPVSKHILETAWYSNQKVVAQADLFTCALFGMLTLGYLRL
jgi:hypothetical protein